MNLGTQAIAPNRKAETQPQMTQTTPKSEANQAPEPTPLRVTPAASAFDVLRRDKYAPVAPRSVAARL